MSNVWSAFKSLLPCRPFSQKSLDTPAKGYGLLKVILSCPKKSTSESFKPLRGKAGSPACLYNFHGRILFCFWLSRFIRRQRLLCIFLPCLHIYEAAAKKKKNPPLSALSGKLWFESRMIWCWQGNTGSGNTNEAVPMLHTITGNQSTSHAGLTRLK